MPIKRYLAYPVRGRIDELAAALRRFGVCQIFPAINRDVLVLVTDTPHEAADEAVQRALADIPTLDALALVAGVGDAILDSDAAPTGAHEEGLH